MLLSMKKLLIFAPIILLIITILLFPRVSLKTTTEHKENWYGPATWSPDGEKIAYFKFYLEYTSTMPLIDLFIAEETKTTTFKKGQLFLAVNDKTGKNEGIVKEITFSWPKSKDTIPSLYSALTWNGNEIVYGTGIRDVFTIGVNKINLTDNSTILVSPDFDKVAELGQNSKTIFNNLELYSGAYGSYGFFGNNAIYLIDHNKKNISIYISDPLLKSKPSLPPYTVTGK